METAQVWTVIGLLAVVFGGLLGLLRALTHTLTDGLLKNTEGLADLKATVGSLDTKVGSLEQKVAGYEGRFESIDRRFDTLEEQGRTLADAIYELSSQFREHLRRHAS